MRPEPRPNESCSSGFLAGWTFVQRAWTIVTRFAFLEFHPIYAFNDYKEYGTWPFDNEHEGDVEGCCVVFRRSALEDFAAGRKTAAEVIPHTVITSAHEEFNDADRAEAAPGVSPLIAPRVQLRVFVAPGSHATYIAPAPTTSSISRTSPRTCPVSSPPGS